MQSDPSEYINHSGGAEGADLAWDRIGREFGVTTHAHWRPKDVDKMYPDRRKKMLADIKSAAIALGRPYQFQGVQLVWRNWFQAEYAQAVFAIGSIIDPGEQDHKGFVNKTNKQIVAGGTGWAVEMAIQKGKKVWVFDQLLGEWYGWSYVGNPNNQFILTHTPILTHEFAGIGTRQLTKEGEQAIREVYQKTFIK